MALRDPEASEAERRVMLSGIKLATLKGDPRMVLLQLQGWACQ